MHLTKYLTVIIILIFSSLISSRASTNYFFSGSREAGMANSAVALNSIWSIYHNPAGMALINNPSIGLNYQNKYFLHELSTTSFAGILPVSSGGFGVSVSYCGTESFNQQKFAIGYAHYFNSKVQAGVLFDYYASNLPAEYEPARAIAGEIGFMARPLEKLSIGIHLNNISSSSYKNYQYEKIPVLFRAGAAWQEERFTISSQVELNSNDKARISFGSEVFIVENLALRAGISNGREMSYTTGLGYILNRMSCDIAFAHHPVLGFSSYISIQISFSKNAR